MSVPTPESLAASLLPTPVLNDDDTFEYFWETASPFSQWHSSLFTIDGVTYPNAEAWMMAEKARLFGDEATRAKILTTKNAREIKALGREVAGFDEEVWKAHRADIIYRGNLAKFQQNEKLRTALLATADRTLVEAAPNDAVYGIGIDARKARITPIAQWPGLNLLGLALMRVRTELRASLSTPAHTHPTHRISELIAELEKVRATHGDLPIVYWDQFASCTWRNPTGMMGVYNAHLYFGGMHISGDSFCSRDPIVSEQLQNNTCDFEEETSG